MRYAGLRGATVEYGSHFRRDSPPGNARSKARYILAQRDCVGGHSGGQAFDRQGLMSNIMPIKC
jgi:hypothetical protein